MEAHLSPRNKVLSGNLLKGEVATRFRYRMKSRRIVVIGLLGLAIVAAFILLRALPRNGRESAPGPGARPAGGGSGAPLPVYIHEVRARTLEERIAATGTLLADESVELVSELPGKVVAI